MAEGTRSRSSAPRALTLAQLEGEEKALKSAFVHVANQRPKSEETDELILNDYVKLFKNAYNNYRSANKALVEHHRAKGNTFEATRWSLDRTNVRQSFVVGIYPDLISRLSKVPDRTASALSLLTQTQSNTSKKGSQQLGVDKEIHANAPTPTEMEASGSNEHPKYPQFAPPSISAPSQIGRGTPPPSESEGRGSLCSSSRLSATSQWAISHFSQPSGEYDPRPATSSAPFGRGPGLPSEIVRSPSPPGSYLIEQVRPTPTRRSMQRILPPASLTAHISPPLGPTYAAIPPTPPAHPTDPNQLNSTLRYRMRSDLLKGIGDRFSGDPETFYLWYYALTRRIAECQPHPIDEISILIANTEGDVRKTIKQLAAGSSAPEKTLQYIWNKLKDRFGTKDRVADAIEAKLESLPKMKDVKDIPAFEAIVDVCQAASGALHDNPELAYLNTARGISVILAKLPDIIKYNWYETHRKIKRKIGTNPNFLLFLNFLSDSLEQFNLPYVRYDRNQKTYPAPAQYRTFQTNVIDPTPAEQKCFYHQSTAHNTADCPDFLGLQPAERKRVATDLRLCYRCLHPHLASHCPNVHLLRCALCGSAHVTAMHRPFLRRTPPSHIPNAPSQDPRYGQGHAGPHTWPNTSATWPNGPAQRQEEPPADTSGHPH